MKECPKPLAVVIGGASGIGEAACVCFVREGWRVVVADLDLETAAIVATRLGAHSLHVDIADLASVEAAAAFVERSFGGCDALVVAAAAFQTAASPEELPLEVWQRVVDLCLRGTYVCNTVFGGRMAKRGGGSIVNISSLAGRHSMPLHAYGPAKAAVAHLTTSLAAEWGRSGVRVNCVTPGTTLTPRVSAHIDKGKRYKIPPGATSALGRIVRPDEVAEAIEFLSSSRASAITGADLLVDAGTSCAAHWPLFGGPPEARSRVQR